MIEENLQQGQMQQKCTEENYIFALDIGTRSIIGIVGIQEENLFQIAAVEVKEHPVRAMADGQIEDIRQVARTAQLVKTRLEERVGFPLHYVNVAAAGRALRTGHAVFELDVNTGEGITAQQIHELEMGAVALVREELDKTKTAAENQRFYCVGHAASRYYLDDYPFSTILGHKGALARADVIATFLPAEVVDSLSATMAIIGCEIRNLTLEPIAAMNAVIPAELRLLNLALVDIGAGTSDIAICDGGCVSGYTMATVAGDEITEEIIKKYLVDFETAEQIKHAAAREEKQIDYCDILGFEYSVPSGEVLESIRGATEHLSKEICSCIQQANAGRSPAAVFLVGGGSMTPLLGGLVADGLQLDHKKVAIGGNNFIKRVAASTENLSGPEYATPIGIALTAAANGVQSGFYLFINGKKTRLFRNDVMTVLDALLLCGYQYSELMGHSGRNITYYLDNEKMILRGAHMLPATIQVNGQEASLSTQVRSEDRLDFTAAVSGADASLTLTDIGRDPHAFTASIDGVEFVAGELVMINDIPAQQGQQILDMDRIESKRLSTLREVCALLEIPIEGKIFSSRGVQRGLDEAVQPGELIVSIAAAKPEAMAFSAVVETQEVRAESSMTRQQETSSTVVESAFESDYSEENPRINLLSGTQGASSKKELYVAETLTFAEEKKSAENNGMQVTKQADLSPRIPKAEIQITLNDLPVALPAKEDRTAYQFIDMLNLVELDPTKPQGNIVLLLNGGVASYLDEVHSGDLVEIRWENG